MRWLTGLLLIGLAVGASGCGLLGSFYVLFIDPLVPPKMIAAEHDMSGKRVLIWVDDSAAGESHAILRRALTESLTTELQNAEALGSAPSYQEIIRFRHRQSDYVGLSTAELGEVFEAEEVLLATVERFSLHHEAGEGYYRAQLTLLVKVVDVASGMRLWPSAESHRAFVIKGALTEGKGAAFENRLVRKACAQMAASIGPLFYEHEAPKMVQQGS